MQVQNIHLSTLKRLKLTNKNIVGRIEENFVYVRHRKSFVFCGEKQIRKVYAKGVKE